jgi:hypothetical protein
MQVIENFERFSITQLSALNRLRFGKPVGFLVSSVGQVAFPGRTLSDAAKYMYVVSVADHFGMSAHAQFPLQNNKTLCPDCLCPMTTRPAITFVTFLTSAGFRLGREPYNEIISLRDEVPQPRFTFLKFQTENPLKYSYFLDIISRLWKI